MKQGTLIQCKRWIGTAFTSGNTYLVHDVRRISNFNVTEMLLQTDNGAKYWCPVDWLDDTLFAIEYDYMQEPMFDLEDMELAEILMEEMNHESKS